MQRLHYASMSDCSAGIKNPLAARPFPIRNTKVKNDVKPGEGRHLLRGITGADLNGLGNQVSLAGPSRFRLEDLPGERADQVDRQARILSFGEQQRLAIARAWALKPDVLFLDEPTASLDPAVTQSIEELINLINDAGTKIVMSTHDLGQARRLADEILFLHRGRLIAHAPAGDILNDPKPEEVRAFIDGDLYW